MNLVDMEKLRENSGGDEQFLCELVSMGVERIDTTLTEMSDTVEKQDWDGLSRTIHKLRPILSYAGVNVFNSELIELEKNAREKSGLGELPARIGKMAENLHDARCELERLLSELRK